MEYFQWARNKLYGSDMEEWAIKKKQQPKLHRVNSPPKMTSIRSSSYYVWSNFALHDTFSFFVCVCVHFYFEWSKCLLLLSRVNCELYTRTHTHTFKYARYWVIRDQFFFIQSRSNLLLGLWPFTLKILRKANEIHYSHSIFTGWIYRKVAENVFSLQLSSILHTEKLEFGSNSTLKYPDLIREIDWSAHFSSKLMNGGKKIEEWKISCESIKIQAQFPLNKTIWGEQSAMHSNCI